MNKINIFELKSISEQEANEFFDKFIRKLPRNADQSFNKLAGGFDDNDVDAIRHAYTSGIFTQVYGDKIALILGEMNELTPMGGSSSNNTNSSKMDLWNNKVGIKYEIFNFNYKYINFIKYLCCKFASSLRTIGRRVDWKIKARDLSRGS